MKLRNVAVLAVLEVVLWGCSGSGGGDTRPGADAAGDQPGADAVDTAGEIAAEAGADALPEGAMAEVAPDILPDVLVDTAETLQPCTKDDDCTARLTLAECQLPSCDTRTHVCSAQWDSTCCPKSMASIVSSNFDSGMPAGWVVDVPPMDKTVTWGISTKRSVSGTSSLYFGDPKCATYYNGAMTNCQPTDPSQSDAGWVRGTVTTPTFTVPLVRALALATFYLFVDSQKVEAVPMESQPDLFQVFVVNNPGQGDNEKLDLMFSSMDLTPHPKSTDGTFAFIALNLDNYLGTEIALRFSFNTLDNFDNFHEGVYIDDFNVGAACGTVGCTSGQACTADGNPCTDDSCIPLFVPFADAENPVYPAQGYCGYPAIAGCSKPQCAAATVATDCTGDPGTCNAWTCSDAFQCVATHQDGCCVPTSLLTAGFDDGTDGFSFIAYLNSDTVKWQVSSKRSVSAPSSLYYGNPAAGNYDTPGAMNFGEATSPLIALPADGDVFLSFQLWMSTEYDDTVPSQYYNPLGIDLFEVLVVESPGANEIKTQVWSSNNILGTTSLQWLPVGVDLTAFKGKQVAIRFAFNTGSADDNTHEGVYVDDVVVKADCVEHDCMTVADCGYDGYCLKGACTANVCTPDTTSTPPAGCCGDEAECETGDPCFTYACINHQCYSDPVAQGPTCCTAETFGNWSFPDGPSFDAFALVDTGVPGTGGAVTTWRYSELKSESAPGAIYFGDPTGATYDNGGTMHSTLTSPAVAIPGYGIVTLSFWLYVDVEPSNTSNNFWIEALPQPDGDAITVFQKSQVPTPASTYGKWFQVTGVDLTAVKGESVKLRITFDGKHSATATGVGVYLDDLVIQKACPST